MQSMSNEALGRMDPKNAAVYFRAQTNSKNNNLNTGLLNAANWFWRDERVLCELQNRPGRLLLILQVVGWLGLCIVTFFSLTLWYNTVRWDHIAHTGLQSLMGLVLSSILHLIILAVWNKSTAVRIIVSFLTLVFFSGIWTVLRLQAFIWLTSEKDLWQDFGGWYFGSFFIFVSWGALFYGVQYYLLLQQEHSKMLQVAERSKEEQLKRLKAESAAKEAEIKMLRYQINPHFLFNTLNSIHSLVQNNRSIQARDMIIQLSEFLRYSLDFDPLQAVTLEQELGAIMRYLEIEKTRFSDRLTVEVKIDNKAKHAKVPNFILQPLIENSIKYAIAESEEGGSIDINARVVDDNLVIELCDSGPGGTINISEFPVGRGVGLKNTLERLHTIYDGNGSFEMSPLLPYGLKVTVRIPYQAE